MFNASQTSSGYRANPDYLWREAFSESDRYRLRSLTAAFQLEDDDAHREDKKNYFFIGTDYCRLRVDSYRRFSVSLTHLGAEW